MKLLTHSQLLDLSGKVAIVTGGSLGIGYGITARLAEAGAKVVIASRNIVEANQAVIELSQLGYQVKAVKTDVAVEAEVKNLMLQTEQLFGGLDILVNNAGIYPYMMLAEMTSEKFDQVIATNLRGVFLTMKFASELMIKQARGGKIINITSVDALHPSMAGLAAYDASKHGVWGFTKNAALELAKHQIWVNAIAPGGVTTPGTAAMQSGGQPVKMDRNPEPGKLEIAMGRMGVPDEIGKVALFLASDMASYMTGSQIVVDGGLLLK